MERFTACFAELEDPREDNARHGLHEILLIALCALLCGAEDCSEMAAFGRAKEGFLRQFLTLRHGIPSHDTFSRVFRLLDPVQFHACFLRFMQDFAQTAQGVIAIDGKTLRRSFDRAAQKSPLHLVSAWAAGSRLLLGQLADKPLVMADTTDNPGSGYYGDSTDLLRGMIALDLQNTAFHAIFDPQAV